MFRKLIYDDALVKNDNETKPEKQQYAHQIPMTASQTLLTVAHIMSVPGKMLI